MVATLDELAWERRLRRSQRQSSVLRVKVDREVVAPSVAVGGGVGGVV